MGVTAICARVLMDTSQPVTVHHAAAAVLQAATTSDDSNVATLSDANILPRLISLLFSKHRCGSSPAVSLDMVTLVWVMTTPKGQNGESRKVVKKKRSHVGRLLSPFCQESMAIPLVLLANQRLYDLRPLLID
jgi:hypothetical protein